MSVWEKAQYLPVEHRNRIHDMYRERFPIDVRIYLASWLENRVHQESPEQQRSFVEDMCQEIVMQAEMMMLSADAFVKVNLKAAADKIHAQFSRNPHELFAYLKHCIDTETQIVDSVLSAQYAQTAQAEVKYSEILNGSLQQSVKLATESLRALQANTESFLLSYHEAMKYKGQLQYLQSAGPAQRELEVCLRMQIENSEAKLNAMVVQIKQEQVVLIERMKKNIESLEEWQKEILDKELIMWKREQQLSGNGVPMQRSLNTIQEWCEHLADMIWTTRQQVLNATRLISNPSNVLEIREPALIELLTEMNAQVSCLLSTLVTSTFVIEKQPPQVMKTNTRFTATARLLVGGQLNVHMTPPRVTVSIISEQQAQLLLKSESGGNVIKPPAECGEILNNTGSMEYQPANKQLSVSFRNMQLRKIKRAEKKGTESVMDEKLTLFFQSKFKVAGGELDFHVWTLSLPVVVIVHGNQEPHGWATVTWDNAFSELARQPFAVPDKVKWGQLADTLCIKFMSATSGSLSLDNLRFLAEKLLRSALPVSPAELAAVPVSWSQFCKDALPERNFTFWEWFYMVMKVTRDCLRSLWCDNLIMGFIQKKQAEEMLSKCPSGTFLLRFSDSELGGITIAWVCENEVFSLQPFTSRDLALRSLADRVLDLPQLMHLYPDVAKAHVFAKYCSKPENEMQKNGYVKPVLVTTLPPHYMPAAYAHSPDSHRNTPSVQSSYLPSMTPYSEASFLDHEILDQMPAFNDGFASFDFPCDESVDN